MIDLIRRDDVRLIALEYISDSMERHGALEAIRALPAVQPDAELAMRIAVKMEAHAALGTNTKAKADAILALIDKPGKEVMPDEANDPRHTQSDTAPAGLSAGGGAEPTAVRPVTVRLVFSNADATPKTTVLDVSAEAVPDIMAWYGAYCAGDRYTVTVDGRNVPMDQNGEPAHVNETPKSEHVPGDVLTPATKEGA